MQGMRNKKIYPLHWRHNGNDSVSNHHPHDCSLNRLFRRRSKKISKLRVTGLCAGNSQETDEFPAQMASNAENVSIWLRHHAPSITLFRSVVRPTNRYTATVATERKIDNASTHRTRSHSHAQSMVRMNVSRVTSVITLYLMCVFKQLCSFTQEANQWPKCQRFSEFP